MNRRALTAFLAIAFGGSWAVQIAIFFLFRDQNLIPKEHQPTVLTAAAPLLMWPPAIGAIVARKWIEKSSLKAPGFALPERRWLLWAWGLPVLIVFATLLASLPLNPLDTSLTPLREAFEKAGQEPPMPLFMLALVQIIAGLTVGPIFNSIFAFGEEYGWRGYLLPRLIERLGARRGIPLHGAIWGIWHAPLIFLIGYNYPAHPYLGVPLFVIFCTLMGIVFAWLQLGSRSIWAPTLAHGTINALAGLPLLLLSGVDTAVSGTISSAVGIVVVGVVVLVLLKRRSFALITP